MLTIFLYDKSKSNESFQFTIPVLALRLSTRLATLIADDTPLPSRYDLLWEWHHCGKINELRGLAKLFFTESNHQLDLSVLFAWFREQGHSRSWDLTLYFLFVHLMELLEFDSVIDSLSNRMTGFGLFYDLYVSFLLPFLCFYFLFLHSYSQTSRR
jgi:hypothetical protein